MNKIKSPLEKLVKSESIESLALAITQLQEARSYILKFLHIFDDDKKGRKEFISKNLSNRIKDLSKLLIDERERRLKEIEKARTK